MAKKPLSLKEKARRDLGRVMLAREDFAFFCEYMSMDGENSAWYQAYKVHQLIAMELMEVLKYLETGGKEGTQFLMVLLPPQHGKTQMISKFFPAFALGHLPNLQVLQVSYGADLAAKNSRFARDLLTTPRYQGVFGNLSPSSEAVELSADSKGATAWELASPNRGGMIAAGVGGAVPGQAKGLGIFDDPIKGHKESRSKKIREDAWEFYQSAFRVRMKAGVLVMTHWHPDDPAGKIMKDMLENKKSGRKYDKWRILSLPGVMEKKIYANNLAEQEKKMQDGVFLPLRDALGRKEGEVLCPELCDADEMERIRNTLKDFYFSALYQQTPYDKEGQRYRREWFEILNKFPDSVDVRYIVRYWDKANSTDGDYTAGVLMAYGSDGNFYIIDVARGQWSAYKRKQELKKISYRDRERWGGSRYGVKVFIWHQQDPGSAGKDSAQATNRLLQGFPVFFEPMSGKGAKPERSDELESAFQGGLVFLIKGAWNDDFIDECIAFDKGEYDDQVDAASSAYNKLLEMIDNGGDPTATAVSEAIVVSAEDVFSPESVGMFEGLQV